MHLLHLLSRRLRRYRWHLALGAALLVWQSAAWALSPAQALALCEGDSDSRVAALHAAMQHPDAQLASLLHALLDDTVQVDSGRVLVQRGSQWVELAGGVAVQPGEQAQAVVNNNYVRRELHSALFALELFDPSPELRLRAVDRLLDDPAQIDAPTLRRALAGEHDPAVAARMRLLMAALDLGDSDSARRLAAARALGRSGEPSLRPLLESRLHAETDAAVRRQIQSSLDAIRARLAWGERFGMLFSGISLGSVLLLAALGLAVTYGLMGVINMAQGEFIMLGAYATYMVQQLVQAHAPQLQAWSLLLAVPASFLLAGATGMLLERTIIRRLYGRPLETLLATWGISLVLTQFVRTLFGPQNVQVSNPPWMSGGWQVMSNLILPYNRIVIIGFTAVVLLAMWLLIARTRLGLFVRAVTQNRAMASCVGVRTARIDMLAFGLGTGIAGLAGCALSQVGNVGPEMGGGYIVDCFMVVVLGGVGQLAGSVAAAFGLGIVNTLLEGVAGAVLAKIAVLIAIILFIQKRPQGLFALKGRSA